MTKAKTQPDEERAVRAHQKLAELKQELDRREDEPEQELEREGEAPVEVPVFSAAKESQPEPTFATLEEVEWELAEESNFQSIAAEPAFEQVGEVEIIPVAKPVSAAASAPQPRPRPKPNRFVATARCPNCEREFPIDLRRRGTECTWCSFFVSRPSVYRQRQG